MNIDPTRLGQMMLQLRWPLLILAVLLMLGLIWMAIRNHRRARHQTRNAARQYALRVQLQDELEQNASRYEQAAEETQREIAGYQAAKGDQQKYPALKSEPNPTFNQFIERGLKKYASLLSSDKAPRMISLGHHLAEQISLEKQSMQRFLPKFREDYGQLRQAFFQQLRLLSRVHDEIANFARYRSIKPEVKEWVNAYRDIFQRWAKNGQDKSMEVLNEQLVKPILSLNTHHPDPGFTGKTQPLAQAADRIYAEIGQLDTQWQKQAKSYVWTQRKCARLLRRLSVLDSTLCAPTGWRKHLPKEMSPNLASKVGTPKKNREVQLKRWLPILVVAGVLALLIWALNAFGPSGKIETPVPPNPEETTDSTSSRSAGHSLPAVPAQNRMSSFGEHAQIWQHTDSITASNSVATPDTLPHYGIDVSHNQGVIDWTKVAADSSAGPATSFAIIKATEGVTFSDPQFAANWSGARAVGLKTGAYHFFSTESSPTDQVQHFSRIVQLRTGDLRPIVDVESSDPENSLSTGALSQAQFRSNLQELLQALEDHYGVKPIIYTGHYYYKSILAGHFPGYDFWLAEYDKKLHLADRFAEVLTTQANERALMWQFSECGQMSGIDQDCGSDESACGTSACVVDLNYVPAEDWARLFIP